MKKKAIKKQVRRLKDLIKHCWVHSGYADCGFAQMTDKQKRLYNKTIGRKAEEP